MIKDTFRQPDYVQGRKPVSTSSLSYFAVLVIVPVFFLSNVRAEPVLNCVETVYQTTNIPGNYGPYDYTNAAHVRDKLPVVERYHFTPKVEQLVSGEKGRDDPMSDIAYVLRAFPNHHRALYAMVRYDLHSERPAAPGTPGSADCWFHKAMTFKPGDGSVLTLYGFYLHRSGRLDEALDRYTQALNFLPDSAEIQYNLGLLYFDLSEFSLSRTCAIRAYELGYPLPGLRKKLEKIDRWEDSVE